MDGELPDDMYRRFLTRLGREPEPHEIAWMRREARLAARLFDDDGKPLDFDVPNGRAIADTTDARVLGEDVQPIGPEAARHGRAA